MEKNSTASLVLGILGILFCWIPVFGAIMPILAIILGNSKEGAGIAGIVLGWIGLVPTFLGLIFFLIGLFAGIIGAL